MLFAFDRYTGTIEKEAVNVISCTEFIPAYSAFFSFLEARHGHGAVKRFWELLFTPDGKGIPLVLFVERSGIRGCYEYWSHSLNEEAADFTMYLNEKRGFFRIEMHHCPSKGRLLDLKQAGGPEPYPYYCLHCDYYRGAVEKCGLKYVYDFTHTDKAACSILIYDPKIFDGRVIVDEDTEIMDRKASQNEYFHRDFHHSLDRCVRFVGESYGDGEVRELLAYYAETVLGGLIEQIKEKGLAPLEAYIRATYEKEKAPDAVFTEIDGDKLTVRVAYCPAVKHLREHGHEVSPWFSATTEYVMATIAEKSGLQFEMSAYDDQTGQTAYRFRKENAK